MLRERDGGRFAVYSFHAASLETFQCLSPFLLPSILSSVQKLWSTRRVRVVSISRFPNLSSQNVKSTKEGRKEREKSEARTTLLRILGGKWASPRVKATRLKGRKLVRSRRGNREHVIATNYAEVARNMALLAAGHLLLAPSSPLLNKLTESCCDSTATTYIGTRPYVTA